MYMRPKSVVRPVAKASTWWLAVVAGCMLVCAACRHEESDHAVVQAAAQQYYGLLLAGDYEGFVSATAGTDSLPASYRAQMVDMVAQHMAALQDKGGMVRAVATRDSLLDSVAYVFLDVTFGDSTVEQVGLKMVREGGRWKMR